MIIINTSYIQILTLYFCTLFTRNHIFYISYTEKPDVLIKLLIIILNLFSLNKFNLQSIKVLRKNYQGISDQKTSDKLFEYNKELFNHDMRTGGQIYLEVQLRWINWKNVVSDELFEHFFFKNYISNKKNKQILKTYKLLVKIRNFQRLFINRLVVFKTTLVYILFFLRNYFFIKLKSNLKNKSSENNQNFASFIIHPFTKHKIKFTYKQKQDLKIETLKLISKKFNYQSIQNEGYFIEYINKKISKNPNWISFEKILKIIINLFFNLLFAKNFIQKSALLIDRFISIYLFNLKLPKDFRILGVDPIEGKVLPIFYFLTKKGYEIGFTSFSIGHYSSKSFSDYNGPYSFMLSQDPGFSEIVKKSGFNGRIIESECFLTLQNETLLSKLKRESPKESIKLNTIKIIIPENHTVWFTELSFGEYENFAWLINQLSLNTDLRILIKRKKDPSYLEDYMKKNYSSFNGSFSSALGGYMLDFIDQNFILSLGLSSIATKASNRFQIPYIVYDRTNRSI